jgi:hypothetical protein
VPIRHGFRTAIADNPAYDLSKDEWNQYQYGENVMYADFTLPADSYDLLVGELAIPAGIEYTITDSAEVAIL